MEVKVIKNIKGINPCYVESNFKLFKANYNSEIKINKVQELKNSKILNEEIAIMDNRQCLKEHIDKYGILAKVNENRENKLTIEEIRKRISYATDRQQKAVKLRFGSSLLELYYYPNDRNKTCNNVNACLKFITTEPFLYKHKVSDKKDINEYGLLAKVNKDRKIPLTIEEIRKRVSFATDMQKKAMKVRYGENLLELYPYPDDEHKTYSVVSNCLKFITKEPFMYKNEKENVEKYGLLVKVNKDRKIPLTIEEIRIRVSYATNMQQNAMKVRYGTNLEELYPFPNDDNKTYSLVNNCFHFITTEPFIYKNKEQHKRCFYVDYEDINKYGILAKVNKDRENKLTIEEIRKRVSYAPVGQQMIMKQRYGENLLELHPYNNKQDCIAVFHCLKFINTEPFIYKNVISKFEDVDKYGLLAIINKDREVPLTIKEIKKRLSYTPLEWQNAMKVRFGKNLLELHPYPREEYSKIYNQILRCLAFISQENFKYEDKKDKIEDVNEYGLLDKINRDRVEKLTIEEIRKRVSYSSPLQQSAMKKRFGESLLELNPYPKDNNKTYNAVKSCLKFITKEHFIYKPSRKITINDDISLNYQMYLYTKYSILYKEIINENTINNIIVDTMNNCNYSGNDKSTYICLEIERKILQYINNDIIEECVFNIKRT